jgi:hypothetical protein
VHNLGAVKQQLWGLEMEAPCAVGEQVLGAAADGSGNVPLGRVTSYIDTPSGQHRALAYLKCRSKGAQVELEGVAVTVGGARGRVVAPPFLSRGFHEAAAAAEAGSSDGGAGDATELAARKAEAQRVQEEEEAAAATARAERLAQMQQRLAAWQAQQEEQQQ